MPVVARDVHRPPSDAAMKTLVFCTSFAAAQDEWRRRYRRWVDAARRSPLRLDQLLIVDDGSPVLPDWPDLTVLEAADIEAGGAGPVCYHFPTNLGRKAISNYPGWYRSFGFAVAYARSRGFDKLIHVESDACLISARLADYMNALTSGWTALWCPRYRFPESAIQAICADRLDSAHAFFSEPYARHIGKQHETMLPFSRVERDFVGDRYGDYAASVPRRADYAAQIPADREPAYYWWLGAAAR